MVKVQYVQRTFRITIPKDFAKALKLHHGSEVLWRIAATGLELIICKEEKE